MCGIFGVVTEGAPGLHEQQLGAAGLAMAHRGPDDAGAFTLEGRRRTVNLVHRRLSIVDLSALGHQPMQTDDGRFTIVFNGEVFNHRVLRAELTAMGVDFRSSSDTEVVLYALAHWGPAAIERFVGMFALALWDSTTETLLLARDRIGQKPLYWGYCEGRLYFASETRALVAAGLVGRYLDDDGLAAWLETGSAKDPRTLLRGVDALLPGHVLISESDGAPVIRRYWHGLTAPVRQPLAPSRDALRATLKNAVKLRLEADVPVAVFLSGGVDSAAITALAAEGEPERVHAFTVAFDDARFDERERATAIARHLGVAHEVVTVRPDEILVDIDRAFDAQDMPSYDGINTWLVSRAAREAGFVVALAGTGGDELFAGYPHFLHVEAAHRWGRLAGLVPSSARRVLEDRLTGSFSVRTQKALRMLMRAGDIDAMVAIVREVFSPSQRRALLGPSHFLDSNTRHASTHDSGLTTPSHRFSAITRAELDNYMRDTQLRDIDVMSMAHGLEIRAPLLDHRVVEQALALCDADKRPRAGMNKALLVELADLPLGLMRAPKRGFVLPWDPWLRGPLKAWAESQLFGGEQGQILIASETRRLWDAFLSGRQGVNYSRILALIALRKWSRRLEIHR